MVVVPLGPSLLETGGEKRVFWRRMRQQSTVGSEALRQLDGPGRLSEVVWMDIVVGGVLR